MAILCIFTIYFFISTTISLSFVNDQYIMIDLMQSLGDSVPSTWNSLNFYCSRTGVTCDTSARVTSISFPHRSLVGTLPQSLTNLSELQVLALQSNELRGKLPSFANMMSLKDISLERNSFVEIPEDFVLGLTNLLRFSISHNPKLAPWNLPVQLKACSKLTTFFARNASLAGRIPNIFYTFPDLANVSLSYNNLTGPLPKSFGSLKSLINLGLKNNSLTGSLPESLTTLSQLQIVDVSNNNFTGRIPKFPSKVDFTWKGNPLLGKNIASGGGSAKRHSVSPDMIVAAVAAALVLMSVIFVLTYIFYVDRQHPRLGTTHASSHALNQIRAFHIEELRKATLDFSEQVGRGGHGEVFKGTINGTEIAVKRMLSGEEEFQTEIKVLTRVKHTNLVSLFGYCTHDQVRYLVYEFMPEGTLYQRLYEYGEHAPLDWTQRIEIALDVAKGMQYLHKHGYIHCDLKTQNILLDYNMTAKVADFGMVKTKVDALSQKSHFGGTVGYIAPEYSDVGELSTKYEYGDHIWAGSS